jgi:hypothetical protein
MEENITIGGGPVERRAGQGRGPGRGKKSDQITAGKDSEI